MLPNMSKLIKTKSYNSLGFFFSLFLRKGFFHLFFSFLFLREINMHAGSHDRSTYRAGSVSGPTRRTQAQMPARQHQHPRLPLPAPPANPLPRNDVVFFPPGVAASTARLCIVGGVVVGEGDGDIICARRVAFVANAGGGQEDLLEIRAERVGGGFVRLREIFP